MELTTESTLTMSDSINVKDGNEGLDSVISEERLSEILDERFDIEALAQMVEHLDYANKLSGKLTTAFGEIRSRITQQGQALGAAQQEIRDLIMDVALLKRAMTSLGHVGVMERRKVERELVRELFPPTQPRPGAGIAVNISQPKPTQKVDCESRLHLCKAACCRIFNVHLTPQEVIEDRFDWEPRQPYSLRKTQVGCSYLTSGGCSCTLYESRPNTCRNYSCAGDKRIWQDFEKKVLNPDLEKRLATLDADTTPMFQSAGTPEKAPETVSMSNGSAEEGKRKKEKGEALVPPSAGKDATVSSPKVAPPNFDELRKLMVPKPANRFVPPGKGGTEENGNAKRN